ncbi:MAG: DUF1826 domain-containing protein [Alphaproteobacteria bacterium]|nr:DUF1826 domain-containing protein [Alphaproteobacteria bacterium]
MTEATNPIARARSHTKTTETAAWSAGPDGLAVTDSPVSLMDWERSARSAAIWRRSPPDDMVSALEGLPINMVTGWRLTGQVDELEEPIRAALSTCGIANEALQRDLTTDMTSLGRILAVGTQATRLELRFDVVKDDACRKFHTDAFPERLAVTYLGPGTVMVPNDFGAQALAEQEEYTGPELEIPQFWVSLFAGRRSDRSGLIHRSPQISGTKQSRLFFCANVATP